MTHALVCREWAEVGEESAKVASVSDETLVSCLQHLPQLDTLGVKYHFFYQHSILPNAYSRHPAPLNNETVNRAFQQLPGLKTLTWITDTMPDANTFASAP